MAPECLVTYQTSCDTPGSSRIKLYEDIWLLMSLVVASVHIKAVDTIPVYWLIIDSAWAFVTSAWAHKHDSNKNGSIADIRFIIMTPYTRFAVIGMQQPLLLSARFYLSYSFGCGDIQPVELGVVTAFHTGQTLQRLPRQIQRACFCYHLRGQRNPLAV